MIRLVDLEKIYYSKAGDVRALKDINIEINEGEIFGIIGSSGAGKSTLVRCINMLEKPTSGKVFVDGQELTAMSEDRLRNARQSIGMVFQHFNLLTSRTVYQNIAFPLEIQGKSRSEIDLRVKEMLELVQLQDRGSYYPSQLSGGQKQRVGIARALASNPKVLLCDEATSALDPQTTGSILQLLKDINEKFHLTIVLITHQMDVVTAVCDRVAVMEDGVILEEGDMADVFIDPKHPTTGAFTKTVTGDLPASVRSRELSDTYTEGSSLLVKLAFIGDAPGDRIVSDLAGKCGVDVSIRFGNISEIKDRQYGILVIEISGDRDPIEMALKYMENCDVKMEVLGYGH